MKISQDCITHVNYLFLGIIEGLIKSISSYNPLGLTSLTNIHNEGNLFLGNYFSRGELNDSVEERWALIANMESIMNERLGIVK